MLLVQEYRGNLIENTHEGNICVVDENKRIIFGVGDVNALTYYRSASKPFQLLPLMYRQLEKKYNLTDEEVTVCASSHTGEEIHINALETILQKTNLKEQDMIMLPTLPANEQRRDCLISSGSEKRKLYHNCSGKHLALMLLQRELTGSTKDYWQLSSPAQQEVLKAIAYVSDCQKEKIVCGVDGCGVPVFAVPLHGIAIAYAKLANPGIAGDKQTADALKYILACIKKHPHMIRGHGFLCGEINTLENIIAKGGAEGVYGFGLIKQKIGVSLKIFDGNMDIWPIVIAEILHQLGIVDEQAYLLLSNLKNANKINDNNQEIGVYSPAFKLKKLI